MLWEQPQGLLTLKARHGCAPLASDAPCEAKLLSLSPAAPKSRMRGVPSVHPSGLREVPLTFGLLLLPLSVRGVLSICCASEHSTSPVLPVWFGRVSAFSVA